MDNRFLSSLLRLMKRSLIIVCVGIAAASIQTSVELVSPCRAEKPAPTPTPRPTDRPRAPTATRNAEAVRQLLRTAPTNDGKPGSAGDQQTTDQEQLDLERSEAAMRKVSEFLGSAK